MLSYNVGLLLVSLTGTRVLSERFKQPEIIRWGASAQVLEAALTEQCSSVDSCAVDPPSLPNVEMGQIQIDCEGFPFRDRGRHIEFVLRDDRLVMVWLMMDPLEQEPVLREIRAAFGQPSSSNRRFLAFERQRTAWRFKPAAILFYSPELDGEMAAEFR